MPWETYRQAAGGDSARPSSAGRGGRWSGFREATEGVSEQPRIQPEDIEPTETNNEGPGVGAVAAGAGLLGLLGVGAAAAAKLPGTAGRLGKLVSGIGALRQQAMLSGLAVPKSALGNVGAGIEQAAEGRGLGALREILSLRTAKDAVKAMRTPAAMQANPAGAGGADLPGWLAIPGRVMSGMDEATQAALQRAGMTAKEAQAAVLQTPLAGPFKTMESGVGRWLFPFRRTPFNQFFGGLEKIQAAEAGDKAAQRGLALYGAAGAAHGAATSDEQYPMSVPIAIAMAARYGLPYAAAAIAGRALAGRKDIGGIAGSALPVSEYGFGQSIAEPVAGFEPAALRVMRRMLEEE